MGKASARIADNSDSKEFAALLGESMNTKAFEGNVVKGKIIEVQEDAVIIDVGLKSEGRVNLREFTTPEMFAELKMNLSERADGSQTTDVVQIDAEVIEVTEEASRYIVSVRFRGLLREEPETPAAPIDEVWHLTKSRSGQGGWLVAGVQQVS